MRLHQYASWFWLLSMMLGTAAAADFHLDADRGDDSRDGRTPASAWRTLDRASAAAFKPGDRLLLRAGQVFCGKLRLGPEDAGDPERPVTIGSFGEGRATIEAGLGYGVVVSNAAGIVVRDLVCTGADRTRNQGAGVAFINTLPGGKRLRHVRIQNIEARGFGRELPKPKSLPEGFQLPQGAGVLVAGVAADGSKSGYEDVEITNCVCHDNAYYGILITGAWDAKATNYANTDVRIRDCRVFENPGDPLYHENHSGSGILVEDCDGGLVKRCVAYENGALCNDAPGGPCGIWTAVARRVVIQDCESFRNRTRTGDGDGFDLDGGCIECVLQYNYSHDNDGAGFLVYTYAGAPHQDRGNVVRWNVSENDARRNRQYGGICLGNSGDGMTGAQIYQNTVIMSRTNDLADCVVAVESARIEAAFWNNLFIGAGGIPIVRLGAYYTNVVFLGNGYAGAGSPVARIGTNLVSDLDAWRALGRERLADRSTGFGFVPSLDLGAARGLAGDLTRLGSLNAFRPRPGSAEDRPGVNLRTLLSVDPGTRDWSGRPLRVEPASGPGALAASLRPLPYPPSKVLRGLEWTSEPHRYPGIHSDMHWQTWGADDAIYSVDGDGGSTDVKDYYGSLSRITGTPPNHKVELVTQFRELRIREEHTPEGMRRYFCGPLAVDSDLYVCLYDYDWRIAGRDVSNRRDFLAVDRYSKLGGIPGILRSRDSGKTWTNVPGKTTPRFLGPNFGNLQFIGFGPGYTRVPEKFGDFVYAISNDSNWESGDRLFLARVPRERVLERAAWEFFSGTAEAPAWTSDETAGRPVFHDPGHVGHSDMTWNPGLGRFLLAVFSDTVPHREDASFEETQRWEKHTELQIYESAAPWGPWGLVYGEEPWGGPDHACYLPHIPAKWLSADGLTGWMLYSGDWEVSHYPKQPYYGYMTRAFRLLK
jgi:hypothetical protein